MSTHVQSAEWVKQRAGGSSPGSSEGAAAAEAAAAAGAAPLPGYGGSMRLLTDLPPTRPIQETLLMQVCIGNTMYCAHLTPALTSAHRMHLRPHTVANNAFAQGVVCRTIGWGVRGLQGCAAAAGAARRGAWRRI